MSTVVFLPVSIEPRVEKCLGLSAGDRVLCLWSDLSTNVCHWYDSPRKKTHSDSENQSQICGSRSGRVTTRLTRPPVSTDVLLLLG